MNLNEQRDILAGAIKNMETTLYLEEVQENYLNLQKHAEPKLEEVHRMSKLKVKMLTSQIKYYKMRLEKLNRELNEDIEHPSGG